MLQHPSPSTKNAFVVTVVIDVVAAHRTAFLAELINNARLTRELESGCRQFDVCCAPELPDRFFLYEIYCQKSDFDIHLASPHFLAFEHRARSWIMSKTVVT